MRGELYVGTSGWTYDSWRGRFYPEGLPQARWLDFYTSEFRAVEVNATFYRLPTERMVAAWRNRAPPGFRFALKGSRYVTHVRRLNDCRDPVERFIGRVDPLRAIAGPLLWQLPPELECDLPLLGCFLSILPGGWRHALEFRHPSWYDEPVFAALDRKGVAAVSVSSLRMPGRKLEAGGMVYLRFHGLEGGYRHSYTRPELAPWAEFARSALQDGEDVWAFFNNDGDANAPRDAVAFRDLVER